MVSNIDKIGIDLIGYFECAGDPTNPKWLHAYLDSGGIWTCGIGTIVYPNGQRVKMGDVITSQQRDEYFVWEIRDKVARVNTMTRDDISQAQFNSLVSLAYNIGTVALQKSSLLALINVNLNTIEIINKFLAWRKDNGKDVPGLIRRRMSEAYHYFTGKLKYDWINYHIYNQATVNEILAEIKK